jgi:hypothetical protein
MTVWPYFEVMNSEVRTEMAARERVMEDGLLNQPIVPAWPLQIGSWSVGGVDIRKTFVRVVETGWKREYELPDQNREQDQVSLPILSRRYTMLYGRS